jgi:hypothetical protein
LLADVPSGVKHARVERVRAIQVLQNVGGHVSGRCRQRGWRVGRDVVADAATPHRASQNLLAPVEQLKLFVTHGVSALYAGKLEGARDLKVALDDGDRFCTVRVGLPSLGYTRSFAVLTLTSVSDQVQPRPW